MSGHAALIFYSMCYSGVSHFLYYINVTEQLCLHTTLYPNALISIFPGLSSPLSQTLSVLVFLSSFHIVIATTALIF